MNRRGFLGLLGASAAAATIPLWIPERKIFLPPPGGWVGRSSGALTFPAVFGSGENFKWTEWAIFNQGGEILVHMPGQLAEVQKHSPQTWALYVTQ
jgi:hypothetical protein